MLIDGYNVIFAHPLWKNLELVEAREMLIKEAINHSSFFDGMIVIVFDGSKKENSFGEKVNRSGVEVIFTVHGEKADSYIERLVYKETEALIYVVTADYEEQKVVFAQGAFRKTPLEFFCDIENNKNIAESFNESNDKKNHIFLEDMLDEETRRKLHEMIKAMQEDF